ncbi:MAG: hypothetical protein LCH53_12370 [Bacteroidetes bacterium]|nr:hypothetical protein [Bacteroidota bacterium]
MCRNDLTKSIEAQGDADNLPKPYSQDVLERRADSWFYQDGIGALKNSNVMYVRDASWANRLDAVEYAMDQRGERYSLAAIKTESDEWYCSLLVWKAYDEQGIDLDGWFFTFWVSPNTLDESDKTTIVYSYHKS